MTSGPGAAGPRALATAHAGSPRLAALRAVHTGVFFTELAAILWLVVSGVQRRRDASVTVAAILVAVEATVFLANDGVCPLTTRAEQWGASHGGVSDIYLPAPVARTIPIWSTALVVLAIGLHLRPHRGLQGA